MSLYAKVDRTTLTVLAYEDKNNPELVDDPDKPKWVPVIEAPRLPFDPATERLVKTEAVTLTSVDRTYTIVALTADELRGHSDPLTDLADALIANGVIAKSDLKSRLGV